MTSDIRLLFCIWKYTGHNQIIKFSELLSLKDVFDL